MRRFIKASYYKMELTNVENTNKTLNYRSFKTQQYIQ